MDDKRRRGQFQPGQSGNPAGKAKGTRHTATLAAEALLDGEAEGLTRKAIEQALEGDATALRLCLERLIPPRRDRPIRFKVGEITSPTEALAAHGKVIEAMGEGEITPTEAGAIVAVLDGYRRAFETVDLEGRIATLEAQQEDKRR